MTASEATARDGPPRRVPNPSPEDRLHGEFYPIGSERPVPPRYRELLRRVAKRAGSDVQVLEVGPERPEISRFVLDSLGSARARYRCVDASPLSVAALRQAGFEAELLDVSREPLPTVNGGFDVVLASEVLEHLANADRFLESCRAALRPHGFLALTTPNLAAWFNRLLLAGGVQPIFTETGTEWVFGRAPVAPPARPVGHLQIYTAGALRQLLVYHGFRPVDFFGTPDTEIRRRSAVVGTLDRLLSVHPALAANLGVIAQRVVS